MKSLVAPSISFTGSSLTHLSSVMDNQPRQLLNEVCWPAFPYQPDVSFAVAHSDNWLLLKYYVSEENVQAHYQQTNEPVYEDSCVECFLSFDETGYYNFEFNCLGVCLAAFGPSRSKRQYLPTTAIDQIQRLPSLARPIPATQQQWQLTVAVSVSVFSHHQIDSLNGKQIRANFYKCGDQLPKPHYLAWNPISTKEPDFHRPEFFGAVRLA